MEGEIIMKFVQINYNKYSPFILRGTGKLRNSAFSQKKKNCKVLLELRNNNRNVDLNIFEIFIRNFYAKQYNLRLLPVWPTLTYRAVHARSNVPFHTPNTSKNIVSNDTTHKVMFTTGVITVGADL